MLTRRENQILMLNAAGFSVKEIANHICRSEFTVQKIISNVKEKVGLQKATELAALYFCKRFNLDFEDFKRQALSAVMIVLLFFSEFCMQGKFAKTTQRQCVAKVRLCRGRKREGFNTFNNVLI